MTAVTFFFFLSTLCLSYGYGEIADAAPRRSSRSGSNGDYVPITYKIDTNMASSCIYENFDKSEFATFSVFVIDAPDNGAPMASITFEGPVAGNADVRKKAEEIKNAADDDDDDDDHVDHDDDDDDDHERVRHVPAKHDDSDKPTLGRDLFLGQVKQWPLVKWSNQHKNPIGIINRSVRVDWSLAGDTEDAVAAREQNEKEKMGANRGGPSKARKGWKDDSRDPHSVTQTEIVPYEETKPIQAPGWYKLCVSSVQRTALMVEMEMRSGKRLGGVDRKTNHVYTHQERAYLDAEMALAYDSAERKLDANTASSEEDRQKDVENQVRERDLHASQSQIAGLNRMVKEIDERYKSSFHRIHSHTASAKRNHEGMMRSCKLETLLYIAITGVQVYTLRKWLLGDSLLGK